MIVAKKQNRYQTRVLLGFWPEDLAALDELAALLQPGHPRPERSHAVRVAVREALQARRKSGKKSGPSP